MEEFEFDDDPFFTEKAPDGWEEDFAYRLGKRRFALIQERMHIEKKKTYRMRDLAKMIIGSSDVMRDDVIEVLKGFKPPQASDELMKRLSKYKIPEELQANLFKDLYQMLSSPFGEHIFRHNRDEKVEEHLQKAAHFALSCIKYDPYWFAKQRMTIWLQNHKLDQILYNERLAGFYVACEDIQLGQYIPAPENQFYRVTAQLVTGAGQIGMILVPATNDMSLKKIRVTRGSPAPPGGLDFVSYAITDMEPEIGRIGYESGLYYQPILDEYIGKVDEEIGYSIGGTIAQWRVSEDPSQVSSLWLYKSPGVPKNVWETFNAKVKERKDPLSLYIFQAKGDIVDFAGDMPLGYQAPEEVLVSLYELGIPKLNTHRYAILEPDKITVEEIMKSNIDEYLSRKSKAIIEKHRKRLGKMIVVPALKFWKKLFSKKIPTRLNAIKGLRLEVHEHHQEFLQTLHFESTD